MVLFLIATYNRPEMLHLLVQQIQSFCPIPYNIIVVDDGSKKEYTQSKNLIKRKGGSFYKCKTNYGKKGYWKVMTKLFQKAKKEEFDYVIKLDDDIQLHPKALKKSLSLFDHITQYKNKRILNMWVDHRTEEKIWTSITPGIVRVNGRKIRRVGWVDGGNWMTNRTVLEILDWQCPEPPESWWRSAGDSSGVGKYLSKKLHALACKIFMPDDPMIYHGDHSSQMHPNKKNRPIEMTSKPW